VTAGEQLEDQRTHCNMFSKLPYRDVRQAVFSCKLGFKNANDLCSLSRPTHTQSQKREEKKNRTIEIQGSVCKILAVPRKPYLGIAFGLLIRTKSNSFYVDVQDQGFEFFKRKHSSLWVVCFGSHIKKGRKESAQKNKPTYGYDSANQVGYSSYDPGV
jgi:hypothetical protein